MIEVDLLLVPDSVVLCLIFFILQSERFIDVPIKIDISKMPFYQISGSQGSAFVRETACCTLSDIVYLKKNECTRMIQSMCRAAVEYKDFQHVVKLWLNLLQNMSKMCNGRYTKYRVRGSIPETSEI